MNKNFIKRSVSLIVIMAFALQQLPLAAPDAHALSAGHFTAPFSPIQEEIHAVKTFIATHILKLNKSGFDFENVPLSNDLFPTITVAAFNAQSGNRSKRVDPKNIVYDGKSDEYVLGCTVNGVPFTARFKIDAGQLSFTSVEKFDPDGARYFPAAASDGASQPPDHAAERISRSIRTAQEINSQNGRLTTFSITPVMETDLAVGVVEMLKKGHDDGIFGDLPEASGFFADLNDSGAGTITPENVVRGDRIETIKKMAVRIKDSTLYPPALKKNLASAFYAMGETFYPLRKNMNKKRMANMKCELLYGLAHQLDETELRYHKSWALSLSWNRMFDDARREFRLLRNKVEALMDTGDRDAKYQTKSILTNMIETISNEMNIEIIRLEEEPLSLTSERSRSLVNSYYEAQSLFDYLRTENLLDFPRLLTMMGLVHRSMARLLTIEYKNKQNIGQFDNDNDRVSHIYDIFEHLKNALHLLSRAYNLAKTKEGPKPDVGSVKRTEHAARFLAEGTRETSDILQFLATELAGGLFYPYEKIDGPDDRETEIHETVRNARDAAQMIKQSLDDTRLDLGPEDMTVLDEKLEQLVREWRNGQTLSPNEGVLSKLEQWLKLQEETHRRFKEKITAAMNGYQIQPTGIHSMIGTTIAEIKRSILSGLVADYADFFGDQDLLEIYIDTVTDYIIRVKEVDFTFFIAKLSYFHTSPDERTMKRIIRSADEIFPGGWNTDPSNTNSLREYIQKMASYLDLEILAERRGTLRKRRKKSGLEILHQKDIENAVNTNEPRSVPARIAALTRIYYVLGQWQADNNVDPALFDVNRTEQENRNLQYQTNRFCADVRNFLASKGRYKDVKEDFSERYHDINASLDNAERALSEVITGVKSYISVEKGKVEIDINSLKGLVDGIDVDWVDSTFQNANYLLLQLEKDLARLNDENSAGPFTYDDFRALLGRIRAAQRNIEDMVIDISTHGPVLETYRTLFDDLKEAREAALSLGIRLDNPDLMQNYINTLENFKDVVVQEYAFKGARFDEGRFQNDCGAYYRDILPRTAFFGRLNEVIDYIEGKASELSASALPRSTADNRIDAIKTEILKSLKEDISPLPPGFNLVQWQAGPVSPLDENQTSLFILFLERKIDLMCSVQKAIIEANDMLWKAREAVKILDEVISQKGTSVPQDLRDKADTTRGLETDLSNSRIRLEAVFEEICRVQPRHDGDFDAYTRELEDIRDNEATRIRADIENKYADLCIAWFAVLDEDIDILQKFLLTWLDKFLEGFVPQDKIRNIEQAFSEILRLMRLRANAAQNVSAIDEKFRELKKMLNEIRDKYYRDFFNEGTLDLYRRIRRGDIRGTIGFMSENIFDNSWCAPRNAGKIKHLLVPLLDANGKITGVKLCLLKDLNPLSGLLVIAPDDGLNRPYFDRDIFQTFYKKFRCLSSNSYQSMVRLINFLRSKTQAGNDFIAMQATAVIFNILLGLPVQEQDLNVLGVPQDTRDAYKNYLQHAPVPDQINDSEEINGLFNDLIGSVKEHGRLSSSDDAGLAGININPEFGLNLLSACVEHYRQLVTINPEDNFPERTPADIGDVLLHLAVQGRLKADGIGDPHSETVDMLQRKLERIKDAIRMATGMAVTGRTTTLKVLQDEKDAIEHILESYTAWTERHSLQHAKTAVETFLQSVFKVFNKVSSRNYNEAITLPEAPSTILTLPDEDHHMVNFFAHYPSKDDYGGVWMDTETFGFRIFTTQAQDRSIELHNAMDKAFSAYLKHLCKFPYKLIEKQGSEMEEMRLTEYRNIIDQISETGLEESVLEWTQRIERIMFYSESRRDMRAYDLAWYTTLKDVFALIPEKELEYVPEEDLLLLKSLMWQMNDRTEWYSHVKGILKALSNENFVRIAVAEDLPINSMVLGNSIIFDSKFIEFILEKMSEGGETAKEAAYILGERLFHELGHISLRDKKLTRCEEEVIQLTRDVILYERISSRYDDSPDGAEDTFEGKMERFTSMKVRTPEGIQKFSYAFHTARLFRKIQEWARKIRSDRAYIESQIRQFVEEEMKRFYINPPSARYFPAFPDEIDSPEARVFANDSPERIAQLEISMLDDICKRDSAFLSKKRRIVISTSLIPDCQKKLINEINERSKEAFESGRALDLIEIKPLSYIQNLRSDDSCDVVALLEETESRVYNGEEKRLVFSRSGDYPVLVNGLVAAGRAVLYKDMEKLRAVLVELSGDKGLKLPGAAELERLLEENTEEFTRILMIALPSIKMASREIDRLNRNIVHLLQFA